MLLNNNSEYIFTEHLSISRDSYLFATPDKTYRILTEIWSKGSFGIVGKNNLTQNYFNEIASVKMALFCNRILETREK